MKIRSSSSSSALSRRLQRTVPEHWGKSELTKFFGLLEEQVIATFAGLPQWFKALERIDDCLACNAGTMFHEIDVARRTTALLYVRSFGTFRAAARLGLSGQLFEATVLTRSVIESAVYAWATGYSETHRTAWAARAVGSKERKAARKLFGWRSLTELLASVDPGLAVEVEKQYSESIDFGAHPNEQGVSLSIDVVSGQNGKQTEIATIYMHGREAILLATLSLLRAMDLVCRLLMLSIGERLRILGIDREIADTQRFILATVAAHERRQAGS